MAEETNKPLDPTMAGNKPGQSADQGLVGQDTDGDGKVVQPGQPPNQSHGEGLPSGKPSVSKD